MINFSDRLFLGLVLDGKEFPLETTSFKSLQMSSNKDFTVPQAQLIIADQFGYLSQNPLADRQTATIILGADKKSLKEYTFRVFNFKKEVSGNVTYFNITLIFNCPRWTTENKTRAIAGATSTDAMRQLATESLLNFNGDSTTDRQTWYPGGDKRAMFAERIARHGYANQTSCMKVGLTLEGELRYKNISDIDYKTAFEFVTGIGDSKSKFSIVDKKEFTTAGQNNDIGGGYKKTTVEQNPLKTSAANSALHSKISVTTTSQALLLNRNVTDRIEGSVVNFGAIQTGNNHSNYTKALHQNKRIDAMYSSGLYTVIQDQTAIDLFDPVNVTVFDLISGKPDINDQATGSYFVSGKTIFVSQTGQYNEKYSMLRAGTNGTNIPASQQGT